MDGDEQKRTTEVRETVDTTDDTTTKRQTVAERDYVPGSVVAQRVVYYVGGAIIALLALRFILLLLAANQANPFVDFVYSLSGIFAAPFFGIFNYEPSYGQSQLEVSTPVAIVIYGLLTVGIAKLFTLGSAHKDEV